MKPFLCGKPPAQFHCCRGSKCTTGRNTQNLVQPHMTWISPTAAWCWKHSLSGCGYPSRRSRFLHWKIPNNTGLPYFRIPESLRLERKEQTCAGSTVWLFTITRPHAAATAAATAALRVAVFDFLADGVGSPGNLRNPRRRAIP